MNTVKENEASGGFAPATCPRLCPCVCVQESKSERKRKGERKRNLYVERTKARWPRTLD